MIRERLESALDSLFAQRLTNREFVQACVDEMQDRRAERDSKGELEELGRQLLAGSADAICFGSLAQRSLQSRKTIQALAARTSLRQ